MAKLVTPTDASAKSINLDDGPPPAKTKPKKASLYQQAGKSLMDEGQSGLGPEGGSQAIMAQKAVQGIVSNVQLLSAILPGVVPLTSELMGRLQMAIPELLNATQAGGMGFVPPSGQPQQPGAPPMAGPPPVDGGQMPPMAPPGGQPPMPPMGM